MKFAILIHKPETFSKMKLSIVFLAFVGVCCAVPILEDVETEWEKFKLTHARSFRSSLEEESRKSIFTETYSKIVTHNELYSQKKTTYYLGINRLADRTVEELQALNGFRAPRRGVDDVYSEVYEPDQEAEVPESLDWRTKGAVTGVKDQGGCASCWAFSATGALEGQTFLKTGVLSPISEQNIVDCCHILEAVGCGGGWSSSAFVYVYINDGVDSEESYPYQAFDNECRYTDEGNVTSLKGYTNITYANEDHLLTAVATIGPISVAIDANVGEFYLYEGGVFYYEDCLYKVDDLNHGVLVVGYGTEEGVDYWLVKNSWGENWGDAGYIKMARNRENNCGIATLATFPNMY